MLKRADPAKKSQARRPTDSAHPAQLFTGRSGPGHRANQEVQPALLGFWAGREGPIYLFYFFINKKYKNDKFVFEKIWTHNLY